MNTEEQRRENHRVEILNILRDRGNAGVTNVELSQSISLRYNDGLHKLYVMGYKIEKENQGKGLYKYTLVSEPDEEKAPREKAYDVLMEEVRKEEIIDANTLEDILKRIGITVRYKPYTYA